jgi:23S rRNA pseudouridine2605 synthase
MGRLNKFIASCGICSRRKADELIQSGRIKVNGEVVKDLGVKVSLEDKVELDGKTISKEEKKVYLMLNKPVGYVTTASDEKGRKNVLDLIYEDVRVYPIGRLDMYTEGLLLLTNDGDFANKLMHPKFEIDKKYIVTTDTKVTRQMLEALRNGVDIGDYVTREAKVEKIDEDNLSITIHEGKNRQVRRMCEAVGLEVARLRRISIGPVKLGVLKPGTWRELTAEELRALRTAMGKGK